jgi:hypothetical protein
VSHTSAAFQGIGVKEYESIKKARSLCIWLLGKHQYGRVRDHFRAQGTFALVLSAWVFILWIINLIAGDHMIEVLHIRLRLASVLHLLEAVSVIVWLSLSIAKFIRKELRDL